MGFLCLADIVDPTRPESWVFQLLYSKWDTAEPAATNEERLAQLKELGHALCEPFKSAALWLKDDTQVYPDRLKDWPNPPKWDNHGGRVTIAGDAAHPMAPCMFSNSARSPSLLLSSSLIRRLLITLFKTSRSWTRSQQRA